MYGVMTTKDVEQFANACIEISTPVFRNKTFYNQIRDLELDDFRLYYLKAACAYFQESQKEIAKEYIDKALSLMESGVIIGLNELDYIKDDKILNSLLIPEFFCKLLDVKKRRVYQLAAEIYSKNEKPTNMAVEYYKKMLCETFKIQPHKAIINKDKVVLYSFRKANDYTLADLMNNQITVCNASEMNDPFDSLANLLSTPEILSQLCEKRDHINPQSDAYKFFRIRSFVANRNTFEDDDSILSNMLMWSHYTDSHKGFCVKYELSKDFYEKSDFTNMAFRHLMPVVYSDKTITIDERIDTTNSFSQKAKCWEYENEVRLITYSDKCDSPFLSLPLEENCRVKEIVFGIRCSEQWKQTIRTLLHNKGVMFGEIKINRDDIYTLSKHVLSDSIN